MTIIRTGATQKYATGWEQAFGKGDKKAQANASTMKSTVKSMPKSITAAKKKKKSSRRVK